MITRSNLIQSSQSNTWWAEIGATNTELYFEIGGAEPTDEQLAFANSAIEEIESLVTLALKYISRWVNLDQEDIGRDYEMRSITFTTQNIKSGQVRIELLFTEDEGSEWWVLFSKLPKNIYGVPSHYYWPVAFGRNQH